VPTTPGRAPAAARIDSSRKVVVVLPLAERLGRAGHHDLRHPGVDRLLDHQRRRAPRDRLRREGMPVGAEAAHRDEHVARLDRARVVAHRPDRGARVTDEARAGQVPDELGEGHRR
jgi:hypothetical protein